MNQILITGEEQVTNRVTEKVKKQKQVLPINGIVIFYAISIIILGICIISGSVYANTKINEKVKAGMKPDITLERNDDNNKVELNVTHVRTIKSIVYRWNDGEEILIDGRERKEITAEIDLIGGKNTLKISVTEENGQTQNLEKEFIVGNIPQIELSGVDNGIQIKVTCEQELDYIEYSWDEGEAQKIEIGEREYQGIINAPRGKHKLKIEAVDINGINAKWEENVTGDTDPTLTVKSELINGKATFIINAEDDENIKEITIVHNGGEQQTIKVNQKTYRHEVKMTEGEINTIIVTAINENDLTKTLRVKCKNI